MPSKQIKFTVTVWITWDKKKSAAKKKSSQKALNTLQFATKSLHIKAKKKKKNQLSSVFTLFWNLRSAIEFQFSSYLHYEPLMLLCSNQIWAVFIGDRSWRCFDLIYCRIWSFGCFGTYLSETEGAVLKFRVPMIYGAFWWPRWLIELCALLKNLFCCN